MRNGDSENQEWHQDRHRVERQAEDRQQAEQPDHRYDGADERIGSQHAGTRIPVEQHGGDGEGGGKETDHAGGAVGDVADRLGKADDVHRYLIALGTGANAFKLPGHFLEVEAATGLGIFLLQRGHHHGGRTVEGNDPAAPVRLADVFPYLGQLFRRAGKVRGHDVATAKAVFDDFGEANVRGKQRSYRAALDALDVEHVFGDLVQGVHERLGVDVAMLRLEGDQNLVGAAKAVLVLQEGLHVLVLERNHFRETGADLEVGRGNGQHHGEQDKEGQ